MIDRRQLERWLAILRHHHPSQLLGRLYQRTIVPWLDRWFPTPTGPTPRLSLAPVKLSPLHYPRPWMTIDDVQHGRFVLLNLGADLARPIDWSLRRWPTAPPLWVFHLHYQEYLLALAQHAPPTPANQSVLWEVVREWIEAHPAPTVTNRSTAWHPYCISRRLPTWAGLLRLAPPSEPLLTQVLTSFGRQADWLDAHRETDIGGNHLWENGRALVMAGCVTEGPAARRWRERGLLLLEACISDQLLPTGEHFERSPMYQHELLTGLVDVADWLTSIAPTRASFLRGVTQQMAAFLEAIKHPDGQIPLWGDATLDHVEPTAVTNESNLPRSVQLVGDYFVHRQQDHCLLFDAGNIGPDHLPAHAHADLLGFELSVGGQRTLVDAGTLCYAGDRRLEYRQSAAHNVLVVNDVELADVWSAFRVGRRGHVMGRGSIETTDGVWLWGEHDAYRRLGLRVRRWWFIPSASTLWFSFHIIWGRAKPLTAKEYLHWHPDVLLTPTAGGLTLRSGATPATWAPITMSSTTVEHRPGAYADRFYMEQDATVTVLTTTAVGTLFSAWVLAADANAVAAELADGRSLTWTVDGQRLQTLTPDWREEPLS